MAPAPSVRDRGLSGPQPRKVRPLPCRVCGGTRLRPEALAVRIQDRNIGDIARLPIREARAWVQSLGPMRQEVSQRILPELMNRLTLLDGAGCRLPHPGPGHQHPVPPARPSGSGSPPSLLPTCGAFVTSWTSRRWGFIPGMRRRSEGPLRPARPGKHGGRGRASRNR